MSTQNPLDSQIIKLIVAMFNAAPGADVLAELRSALTAGESVENLARNLVQTAVFKSLYPDTLGSAEFAARFANNVLGEEVGFDQLAFATVELTALQLAGLDRGQVVLRAIEALLAVEPTNPEWGNARQAFENKVTVAEYYSIEKQKSAQTLEELQEVLAPVTSSEFSTENAIRVVDGLPPLPEPGTPTTPVTPTPEPTPVLSITGLASASVNENSLYSAAPAAVNASGAVRWALSGEDAALFSIDEDTGALSMVARDFEAPVDAGADNRYSITVSVTDAAGSTASQAITVTVADVLEPATLVLSGLDSVSINENLAFAATPSVSGGIGVVSWSLEGADAEQFSINKATGALSMVARNFENAADADGNNVYEITVKAEDADSNSVTQAITVTVNDVQEVSELILGNLDSVTINENIEFTLAPALSGAIGAVTWTLTGPDAEKFSINTATGALSMVARNFESAEDADTNNVYEITITAEDADLNSVSRSINVTIADVLEPATLVLSGVGDAVVSENAPFTLTPGVTGGIGAVTWSLEGPDASRFSIDTSSGEVGMIERDFETPADADGNNVYEITLKAEDADSNSVSQAISVRVDDAIEESELTISGLEASYSQVENLEFKGPVPTVSGAIGAVTWSLEGGDADRFTVDKDTGEISMVARDFETPADSGADNLYNLVLRATDADGNTAIREVDVQVVNVNESSPIAITNISDVSVEENQPFTSAPPGVSDALGTVTWSLSGEDAAHFTINLETGIYEMVARDYERPVDADRDNFYRINVVASDTNGNSAEQAVSIRVTDVEDGPTLIIGGVSSASVPENESYTATATVANAVGAVRWSLGGADAAWFEIDANTGALSMAARDHESPQDDGGNNTYTVTLEVTDEDDNTASTEIVISVADVTEASALSITGLLDGTVDENQTWTSGAPEVSGAIGEVSWSLEGVDAARFTVDGATGALLLPARDFESPADSDGDNVYEVTVRATDADENTTTQALRVTVANVIEPATLEIGGLVNTSVEENQSFQVTPTLAGSHGGVTWRLAGADAERFSINASTGVLSMVARNFEAPADADANNVYEVTVIAEDLDGNSDSAAIAISVADVVETSTLIISGVDALYTVEENSVFTGSAPAVLGAIGNVTWTLEGSDAAAFSIDAGTGVLSLTARDYETPTDADGNNFYQISLRATDADGNTATRTSTFVISDVTEASELTISGLDEVYTLNENAAFTSAAPNVTGAIGSVTWSLEGGDAAHFTVDAATGVIGMLARDFESPGDVGGDNRYNLVLRATDADGNTAIREVDVQITNVHESSPIAITGVSDASIAENSAFTSAAPGVSDALGTVTWSLAGEDAGHFSIDPATGVYSMVSKDFEAPADADGNNVYRITVRASDTNGNVAEQAVSISVTDLDDAPTLIIGGVDSTSQPENAAYAATATVANAVGAVTWSLSGADAALFSIDAATGALAMVARNFEAPEDAGADNTYTVTVGVSDAEGNTASKSLVISIADEQEVSALAISGLVNVFTDENAAWSNTSVGVTGAIGDVTWSLEGADAARFSIEPGTGAVHLSARDFENPTDSDGDNVYEVTLRATDADENTATQALRVTVANVIEPATLEIGGLVNTSVEENQSFQVTPTLAGSHGGVTWRLAGADAERFSINAATGALSMAARNFEAPADADANNVYEVTVIAEDLDGNSDSAAIAISVVDVVEPSTLVISGVDALYTVEENSAFTGTAPGLLGAIGNVTWTLEGNDAAAFSIDAVSGVVSLTARDYEAPTDADGNNFYQISIRATDADGNTAARASTFVISDVIEFAELSIGGVEDTYTLNENTAFTSAAPSVIGAIGSVTWSLEGGDADKFSLNAATGVFSMVARDFEAPADSGADNFYNVLLRATDADGNTAFREVEVQVVNVNEVAPIAVSGISDASVAENSAFTSAAPGVSGGLGSITWSLSGADAARFSIDPATGVYSMVARNYESPVDADGDNVYSLVVLAGDSNGNVAQQAVAVSVEDVIETSVINVIVEEVFTHFENASNIVFPTVSGAIGQVRWTLEGADAALFTFNGTTGEVLVPNLNFENPQDANADNFYEVTLRATDADDNTGTRAFTVRVFDEDEFATPVIGVLSSVTIDENQPFQQTATVSAAIGSGTWSLEGADAARFSINASTGVLSMSARNYEAPEDADGDNTYAVTVKVTDADNNRSTQAITVSVADVIESATLAISGLSSVALNENTAFQQTAAVAGAIGAVTWSLEGADAARFTINASTGVLSMGGRDYEAPEDLDADNVYAVSVVATDADGNTSLQALSVTILDVAEALPLQITSSGTESIDENVPFSTTLVASGGTGAVTWSKTGGSDASLFSLSSEGLLSLTAKDAELAEDADGNNSYLVQVQAMDATGATATLDFTVSVANVEDVTTAIPFNSPALTVNEDATLSFTGADLFAQANFTDDFGVSLSSLTLSGRTGTLTVNGSTIAAGGTALVTSSSALTWRPASNVNGSSILMFNAQATASDGSTSSVVAVNANVEAVADASTLTFAIYPTISGYDINPGIARAQTVFFASAFDNDGSMVLTLSITGNYSEADGDTLGISSSVSPVTAALFTNTWNPGTGTLTITPAAGQTPNISGWNIYLNNIVFSTNDTDVGDSRTAQMTLVSGPDAETKSLTATLPFFTSAGGAEAGMAFSVMAPDEDGYAADAVEDVAMVSAGGQDVQNSDPLAWWQLAESYAMLR